MEENAEEKVESPEEGIPEKQPLDMAKDYIDWGKYDKAQEILNTVKENSAWKYYLQSRIYESKCWYNEQRKMLKKAVKAEPDNEDYKKELQELEEFSKTPEYKSTVKKQQMGDAASLCAECSCYCCLEGLCEAICDGCS